MRRNKHKFPERGTFPYKWEVSPFLTIAIVNTMILHISVSLQLECRGIFL